MDGDTSLFSGETAGVPDELTKRRGLWPLLLGLGHNEGLQDLDQSPSNTPRLVDQMRTDRIDDDRPTARNSAYSMGSEKTSPIGQSPTQRAGAPRLAERIAADDREIQQLEIPAPRPPLKQRILQAAIPLAMIGAGRAFGGPAGGAGAGRGVIQAEATQRAQQEAEAGRREKRLADLVRERGQDVRSEEMEEAANLRNQTLADAIRQRDSAYKPEVHDTEQGPIQWNPATKQWERVTVGGQAIGPKPTKPDTSEQQYIDEYQRLHPGSTLADAVRQYAKDTQRPDRGEADRTAARGDRSYQFHAQRLDKLATPIEQRLERLGRLEDTLAQGSPQADALVAPELLSVMAGGQASGLRMNEAEISRIVGGRTEWENLKAKLGAWQMDPNKGFALTPAQRAQVAQLFTVVKQRAQEKAKILDQAREQLATTDDPMQHRRIYNRAAQALEAADAGSAGGGASSMVDSLVSKYRGKR